MRGLTLSPATGVAAKETMLMAVSISAKIVFMTLLVFLVDEWLLIKHTTKVTAL
jgi:hypothetical protein